MLVATAIALPQIRATMASYRMSNAVAGITGAIQATRYRAIFQGCPSALAFDKTKNTYQLSSRLTSGSCATSFSNVGGAISFGSTSVVLDQNTSLQFNPGGSVSPINNKMILTYGSLARQIEVSPYGNISVKNIQ
jgi:Tfp pilus assembly protein FimT